MKSLKRNILVSIISLTLIGDCFLFYAAIHDSRKALKKVAMDDMISTTKAVGNAVNIQLNEKIDFLNNLSYLPIIQDSEAELGEKQSALDAIANNNKSGNMMGLNLTDLQGNCRVREGGLVNFAERQYFQDAVNGKPCVYGPIINKVTNLWTLFISTPIKDSNGKITGTIFEPLTIDFLCDIVGKMRVGETGYSIIIDRTTGNTIGAPVKDDVINEQNIPSIAKKNGYTEWAAIFDDCLAGNTGSGEFTAGKVKRLMAYSPIEGTNWSAIVMSEYFEYIGKTKTMENNLFCVCVALIIIGILVGLLVSRALNPLKEVGTAIKEIASGNADLTKRLNIKRPSKEIADVVNGFNDFVIKLQEIIISLKNSQNNLEKVDANLQLSTQDSVSSITEIIANIESVNAQIVNQSSSVTETAGAVNEIASNIESLERMINNQSNGVNDASAAIEQMIQNINSVTDSVEKMVYSFTELEENAASGIRTQNGVNEMILEIQEQSKMLQEANAAIANIAEQTNLLAMNAAIEAAHAGEAGKGFSVVADEIRKLSETSSTQSKTIGSELNKVQESIINVVTESSKASTAFTTVSNSIRSTDEILRQIKGAMEEQQTGTRQITSALHTMNESTSEVKAASAEMSEGNRHILKQIENLQEVTAVIDGSITEMSTGAKRINDTASVLSQISSNVTDSINQIKDEIDQFHV